jgi:2-oxoglutarate ferredoxin oxidoreductase subunit delta
VRKGKSSGQRADAGKGVCETMAKKFHLTIRETHCKQCGICSYLCPRQVLTQEMGHSPVAAHLENCIGCRLCEMRCPDFAIEVEEVTQ